MECNEDDDCSRVHALQIAESKRAERRKRRVREERERYSTYRDLLHEEGDVVEKGSTVQDWYEDDDIEQLRMTFALGREQMLW